MHQNQSIEYIQQFRFNWTIIKILKYLKYKNIIPVLISRAHQVCYVTFKLGIWLKTELKPYFVCLEMFHNYVSYYYNNMPREVINVNYCGV